MLTHRHPDRFVLYRILGNDLPPRHAHTQTVDNLRFILQHEATLPGLEKRWIVNRIVDPAVEREILALLRESGHGYVHLPFSLDAYRQVQPAYGHLTEEELCAIVDSADLGDDWTTLALDHTLHAKNQYVMNVNGARNCALRDARREGVHWIMPWDGNCFLTPAAFQAIQEAARAHEVRYVIVPMHRLLCNEDVLAPDFCPAAEEEPQIVFRNDAREQFDDGLRYGRFSKVELLRRLGVPGIWEGWSYQPWEGREWTASPESGSWRSAGWVARLGSGHVRLDDDATIVGIRRRSDARRIAIRRLLGALDEEAVQATLHGASRPLLYDEAAILALRAAGDRSQGDDLASALRRAADEVLAWPLQTVLDKTALAPSGCRQDYHSPAPFWWRNPDSPDGTPFLRRDGERVREAVLFSAASEQYDYSRLQRLFLGVTTLALAWACSGLPRYGRRASEMVQTWFLCPRTRMNPHLEYAQVRPGRGPTGFGIVEAKDFYFFLDAVRMLAGCEHFAPSSRAGLRAWLRDYLQWLLESPRGRAELRTRNNHGTCYDLQVLTIAAYLGDAHSIAAVGERARARLHLQFARDGAQPLERTRRTPLHYCLFNLQSWFNLAAIAEGCGIDLWNYPSRQDSILARGLSWLVAHGRELAGAGGETVAGARWIPLLAWGAAKLALPAGPEPGTVPLAQSLHPELGVPPFWPLAVGTNASLLVQVP